MPFLLFWVPVQFPDPGPDALAKLLCGTHSIVTTGLIQLRNLLKLAVLPLPLRGRLPKEPFDVVRLGEVHCVDQGGIRGSGIPAGSSGIGHTSCGFRFGPETAFPCRANRLIGSGLGRGGCASRSSKGRQAV
jgi:hypothetical protein